MDKDIVSTIRKVTIFSLYSAVPTSLLIFLIFHQSNYVILFLFGLLIALSMFVLNGIVSEYIILKSNFNAVGATRIAFYVRIFIIGYTALKVYSASPIYIVPFMLGYCFHSISILIYGINIAKKGCD